MNQSRSTGVQATRAPGHPCSEFRRRATSARTPEVSGRVPAPSLGLGPIIEDLEQERMISSAKAGFMNGTRRSK
ncbi:MAG: hypothetical protein NTV25_08595 [Methanothrix sp.]|nr:hypothetical protein [Methanothrix sp.]